MIILGRYGDKFCERFYETIRDQRENVNYHVYSYRIFPNTESLPRITNGEYTAITQQGNLRTDPDVRFDPSAEKVRASLRKDPTVVVVVRGASGFNYRPLNEFWTAYSLSKYLKKEMGAEHVSVVLPNMPFAKQDKLFYDNDGDLIDGAPPSLEYARDILKSCADLLISFSPHDFRDTTGWIVKNEKTIEGATRDSGGRILDSHDRIILNHEEDWTGFAYAIDAIPTVAEYALRGLKNPYVVGPDKSIRRAVERISPNVTVADKKRDRHDTLNAETTISFPTNLDTYDIVIIDDLIQAGTTAGNIIKPALEHNPPPNSLTYAAVHGEFAYNRKQEKSSFDIISETGTRLIVTDTLETPVSRVSVVPLLVDELMKDPLKSRIS